MVCVLSKIRGRLRSFSLAREASNAVEFALVMPIFVMMTFGMIGYGYYFGASHMLTQLAAEGARAALGGLDASERRQISQALVSRNLPEFPLLDPSRVVVRTDESGTTFTLTVSYDTTGFPVWSLGLGIVFPDRTIARAAVAEISTF